MDATSRVEGGESFGRLLPHLFVALSRDGNRPLTPSPTSPILNPPTAQTSYSNLFRFNYQVSHTSMRSCYGMSNEEEVQVETKAEMGVGVEIGVGVGRGRKEPTPSSSTSPVRKAVFVQSLWKVDDRKRMKKAF